MRRFSVIVLSMAAALPAYAQGLFDDNEARRRIEALRTQVTENQRLVDERLARIEATSGNMIEIANQIEALRNDIARMRGQIEVAINQIEGTEKRQKDLYLDIDTRLRKLEQGAEKQAAMPEKPAAPGGAETAETPGEARAYQAALDQFKLGNYALAVNAMQGFLVTYPNSKLAPNAQYWTGMAHAGQRNYKAAIDAQRKLLSAWPESDKAPDALLSIASSQETMGDRRAAQKTLEELIARYPTSGAAASAKQRLAAYSKR
ncbi:MAG TPA: tol-pal system protein YbgF [Burkholderiales bacterium]|nr:tol-pal system protein YbgF [Burkholderiales bacterium]